MHESPLAANRFSASREIPLIVRNPTLRYCIHKSSRPVPILNQIKTCPYPEPNQDMSLSWTKSRPVPILNQIKTCPFPEPNQDLSLSWTKSRPVPILNQIKTCRYPEPNQDLSLSWTKSRPAPFLNQIKTCPYPEPNQDLSLSWTKSRPVPILNQIKTCPFPEPNQDLSLSWTKSRPVPILKKSRPVFHDRGTRRRWVVSSTPRPHFTHGKDRYPFYRGLGGPQGRSGRAENLVPTGIRSRTVQPVAQSLYRLNYRPTLFL